MKTETEDVCGVCGVRPGGVVDPCNDYGVRRQSDPELIACGECVAWARWLLSLVSRNK